jgi:hypothetical protein
MVFDWQNLAVLAAVLAAGGYLARLAWQTVKLRKAAACGGCGTCANANAPGQMVGMEALSKSARDLTRPVVNAHDPRA